jgi:hypothetical protein
MKNSHYINIMMIASLLAILSSCSYDFIEYPVVAPPDPNDTVYFAQKIAPIFTTDDKCTSCHKAGGSAPHDFTTGNAYNSIVPGLINSTDPESSLIYWHPHPSSTVHLWKKLSVNEADLILLWIKQGALNN